TEPVSANCFFGVASLRTSLMAAGARQSEFHYSYGAARNGFIRSVRAEQQYPYDYDLCQCIDQLAEFRYHAGRNDNIPAAVVFVGGLEPDQRSGFNNCGQPRREWLHHFAKSEWIYCHRHCSY